MNCPKCNTEKKQFKRGVQMVKGALCHRFSCSVCDHRYNVPLDEESLLLIAAQTKNTGWDKVNAVTEEAKKGNIPEIGLTENLQGLEVTGVTYLKKDADNVLHWVKTKARRDDADAEAFLARLEDRISPCELIPSPERTSYNLLTQYTVTDLHVGMYSWAQETGCDWNLYLCYELISEAINLALLRSENSHTGLFLQLGDMAHYDGHDAVTPTSGNLLDADGRFGKMYDVCIDIHLDTIDKMLQKHEEVKVIIAQGNHDLSTSDTMRTLVRKYYSRNPRVEVIGRANPFYAYQFGKTMIGVHHGHLKKVGNLPSHFCQNFSKMWGETSFRYLHAGHKHCHAEEEKGGALTIQHSTIAAPDAYAAHRFDKTKRSINSITYSDEYGMLSRQIIPYELVSVNLDLGE